MDPTPCKCNTADISSKHIIESCPLFEHARSKIRLGHLTPPVFTNESVLDKEWGPSMLVFLKETGLGFKKELNWSTPVSDPPHTESDSSGDESFEVGDFE
jgi:hypothetical protein